MAVIREKTLKFPGLDNVYTFADEADLFDANVPCSAGEYRIYEGELYRCDADHTGAWNYAHFTPVKLGNEVSTAMASAVGQFAQKTIENVAIATFDDGAENVPVKSLVIDIAPVQSGSGDPAPDNVRPITGWTGAQIPVTGKNLLNINREEGTPNPTTVLETPRIMSTKYLYQGIRCDNYYYRNYVSYSISNGTITVTSSNNIYYGVGFPVACKPNTNYRISATLNQCKYSVGAYDKDWNFISVVQSPTETPTTITTPPNAAFITIVFSSATLGEQGTASNIMLEVGSTATAYEPYTGTTYPIAFPAEAGTVYGGTLDVTNGELISNWISVTVDGSTKTVEYGSALGNDACTASYTGVRGIYRGIPPLCNTLPTGGDQDGSFNHVGNFNTGSTVNFILLNSLTGLTSTSTRAEINAAFNAYLAEHPAQVVYQKGTNTEYQLSPVEIKTLLGQNNIWADTGDIVELTYRTMNNTDAKIRLTKALIAPVLDDMVADTLLAANDFRVVGDTLYIITGSIASGSALIPGTNCTATTIGEQITALLNA